VLEPTQIKTGTTEEDFNVATAASVENVLLHACSLRSIPLMIEHGEM
jgi:hypothetical protein